VLLHDTTELKAATERTAINATAISRMTLWKKRISENGEN